MITSTRNSYFFPHDYEHLDLLNGLVPPDRRVNLLPVRHRRAARAEVGVGVFATRCIPVGTRLFEERPLIAMQHAKNRRQGVVVCAETSTVERFVRRPVTLFGTGCRDVGCGSSFRTC